LGGIQIGFRYQLSTYHKEIYFFIKRTLHYWEGELMVGLKKKRQYTIIFLIVVLLLTLTNNVLAENGTWSTLGDGVNGTINALAVDSAGNLYAGGDFLTAGGETVNRVAKWDSSASTWSALDNGVTGTVNALVVGSNDDLYVGGRFDFAGTTGMTVNNIAQWNGSSWSWLGVNPQDRGVTGTVYAMDMDGSNLYVGGWFGSAGGVTVGHKALWDGNASTWSALGSSTTGAVLGMAVDGSDLYIGGAYGMYIAKWNGSVWSALGSGVDDGTTVNALTMDSSGNLYAGGDFLTAGGVTVNRVAKWDGSEWSALGSGMNNTVNALTTDSSGNLYAGGDFTTAGGVDVNYIAKWDGSEWSALGSGVGGGTVNALATGSLYAGGDFTTAGGESSNSIAVWEAEVAAQPAQPAQPEALPATGFTSGLVTKLPVQGSSEMYQQYNYVSLEIPSLGAEAPIVGVPVSQDGWNLSWLDNQAGWLHGTTFPSWAGNSAITAHVYDANGQPGLFNDLSELKWGDEVIVHAYGQAYVYEVRSIDKYVRPEDTTSVFKHEDYPWLTLITCKGYDEDNDAYNWRVIVRAVQTQID